VYELEGRLPHNFLWYLQELFAKQKIFGNVTKSDVTLSRQESIGQNDFRKQFENAKCNLADLAIWQMAD
jgi:hypothetical protein